jgi:hypothetical protein
MKKNIFCLILIFLSGCFLVISHEGREADVMAVHLLPPKIEDLKPEKPIDVVLALFPFDFDLKFSEKKEPVYLDYSYIPKEFMENLSVIFEGAIVSKVTLMERGQGDKDLSYYSKIMRERKLDAGVFGKVKKFNISKKPDGWRGSLELEHFFVTHDGILLKADSREYSFEKRVLQDNLALDYQIALAVSPLFDKAYKDIIRNAIALSQDIETHKIPREIAKKGIFTFRKADKFKGRSRLMLDIRVRVVLNDHMKNILVPKEKIAEHVKNFVEEAKKKNSYKLVLTVKDKTEVIYPFVTGKLNYDANNDSYMFQYMATKEFNVNPGKSLLIANFHLPNMTEVITKGVYLDVNPDKGASLGFNLICDTKNNYVDMGFIK